jgi:DNA-directed RNA polymerase subunit L
MSNITLLNCVGGHSFGHLMSTELLKDDRVIFAAYKNIHPLKSDIELSIVTLDGVDALTVYKEVINKNIKTLEKLYKSIK